MPYEIDFSPNVLEHLEDLAVRERAIVLDQGDELDIEAWQLRENPEFLALIERSRARYHQEGEIPLHEVRRRLELIRR